jgi:flagellar biosynthesis activator protein FlaF
MSYGVNAYAKAQQQAPLSQRELEAHVLLKAAAKLQGIRDNWSEKASELDAVLVNNRKLWTIFVSNMTDETCPAPLALKQNIVNIGLFVFNHTISLTAEKEPDPRKLDVLININRQIAAGLRTSAESQPAADTPSAA